MGQEQEARPPTLTVSTGWVEVAIISEPLVIMTWKGYAPVIRVRAIKTGLDYLMYLSAKSLAEGLEPLRNANNGVFSGLKIAIRKQSDEKFAKYEVQAK